MRRLAFLLGAVLVLSPCGATAGSCGLPSFAPAVPIALGLDAAPRSALSADVDGDGRADLVLLDASGRSLHVFPGNAGGFLSPIATPLSREAADLVASDLDADGHVDLVISFLANAGGFARFDVDALFGDGTGRFGSAVRVASGITGFGSRTSMLAADVDGDGKPDPVVQGPDSSEPNWTALLVFLHDGPRSFKPQLNVPTNQSFGSVGPMAAGDFDGDGNLDLAVTVDVGFSGAMGSVSILLGDGRGGFRPGAKFLGGGSGIATADLDGDGRLDLVTTSYGSVGPGRVSLFSGDGHGGFGAGRDVTAGVGTRLLGLADVDGDGRVDIVAWSADHAALVITNSATGDLGAPIQFQMTGDQPLLTDFDRDHRPDLLTFIGGDASLRRNVCAAGGASATLHVPFVLSLVGANDTLYLSNLALVNHGVPTADVVLTYTSALGGEDRRVEVTVGGGEQKIFADVVEFLLSTHGGGTLRLDASNLDSEDALDASVTFGSYVLGGGDFQLAAVFSMPAVPQSETLGDRWTVGGLRQDSANRTNLAVQNAGLASDGEIVLRVTLVSTDPLHPGQTVFPDVSLAPGGFLQWNEALAGAGLGRSGYARVERVSGTAPALAYAVRHDRASGDGTPLSAVPGGARIGRRRAVLPAVVETPIYTTEMWAVNTSATPRSLACVYAADAIANGGGAVSFSLSLAAGQETDVAEVVAALRASSGSALPAGPTYAGALFVDAADGDLEGILLGARVSAAGQGGGRVGTGVPSVDVSGGAPPVVWLDGLLGTSVSHTNVAVVNAGAGTSTFRLELFDDTLGSVLRTEEVAVGAGRWFQLAGFIPPFPGQASAYARVTRIAGDGPFTAYAVRNTDRNPEGGTGDADLVIGHPAR